MKRLGIGAILLAMLAGPAFAQQAKEKSPMALEEEQRQRDRVEVDKRYKATMEKTQQNTTTTRVDPWSNIRGADDSKTKR